MVVRDVNRETDGSRRVVDVYAAGCWLTCEDNQVYVPVFAGVVAESLRKLLLNPQINQRPLPYPELSATDNYRRLKANADAFDDAEWRASKFMKWGVTADNVGMLLFRHHDMAILPFSFLRPDHPMPSERGQVFVAELPIWELTAILHDVAWLLMWGWKDRNKGC
jgi:hypothetical protein